MQKAGGIVAIIAGVFGVLAAGVTLAAGAFTTAVQSVGADRVVAFGWYGLGFSFLVIILGAIGISTHRKFVGVVLMIVSMAGAYLGGTLVALFMALSLVAGLLITIGAKRPVKL